MYNDPDDDIYDAYYDDEGEPLYDDEQAMFNRNFLASAEHGDTDAIEGMVGGDVDIDTCDENGSTALHLAAMGGHADIVRILLENDAKVNPKNDMGNTPPYYAESYGHDNAQSLMQ